MAKMTENQERLPNEKELREHQEAIQDIIDIFADTQDLVPGPSQDTPSNRRTQIIPSDTSSGQALAPNLAASRPHSSKQASTSDHSLKKKRSINEAELAWETETFSKKPATHRQAVETSHQHRTMTAQEDEFIWKRYQTHQKKTLSRGLSKKASSGITSQIAEELQTNRQTITARLNVLRKSRTSSKHHEDRNGDVHSLQSDSFPKHVQREDANSRMTKCEVNWSGNDYWADAFPGFCYNQQDSKLPATKEPHHSNSSTSAFSTSAAGSTSRRAEAPLAPPPHIARKSTFSQQDDVILWNAYIRNGCQVLPEAQYIGLMNRLKRSNTSSIDYRIKRLVSEDQGVPIDDIQKCAFTPTGDAHILRQYHANNALSALKQRSEEALCQELSKQVHQESVRVLYRLHYLLNHYEAAAEPKTHIAPKGPKPKNVNNDSEAEFEDDIEGDVSSKDEDSDYKVTANSRVVRETSYRTRHNKKRFYTEDEDMVIWSAYLSATSDIERSSALHKAALEINRSQKGVQHRLQRLLNDQHKAELDCAASDTDGNEDEMSVQEDLPALSTNNIHSNSPGDNAPLYSTSSDEWSYSERDCSSDESSDDENENESESDDDRSNSSGSSDSSSSGDSGSGGSDSGTVDGGNSSDDTVDGENPNKHNDDEGKSNYVRSADPRHEQSDHSSSDTSSSSSSSRVSDLAESTSVFLARLRSTGMDFIAPRSIHYQVLAVVLTCLQQLHTSSHAPLYNDVINSVQHSISQLSSSVPQLQRITTSQLRGVLVLLQRANCVHIHGGPHVNLPITVSLAEQINTFGDLRRQHDRYLETLMTEQGNVKVNQLLWPRDAGNQMYLKKKVEQVARTVGL